MSSKTLLLSLRNTLILLNTFSATLFRLLSATSSWVTLCLFIVWRSGFGWHLEWYKHATAIVGMNGAGRSPNFCLSAQDHHTTTSIILTMWGIMVQFSSYGTVYSERIKLTWNSSHTRISKGRCTVQTQALRSKKIRNKNENLIIDYWVGKNCFSKDFFISKSRKILLK